MPTLRRLVAETQPDLVWVQHEAEILTVAKVRDSLSAKTFLPSVRTLEICQDKMASYEVWRQAGLPVPASMLIETQEDLRRAFRTLGKDLWLRAVRGVGGKGALPVSDFKRAKLWIDLHQGWGSFMAAELMTSETVSSESVWVDGRLVGLQGRRRLYWELSNLTLSGVTGIPGAQYFVSDPVVDRTGLDAVKAIDPRPHGVFSVDMVYDAGGVPRITEINAGRFMSGGTIHVALEGFSFPYLLAQAALGELPKERPPVMNPLPQDVVLVHGMDTAAVLVKKVEIEKHRKELAARIEAAQAPEGLPVAS